MAIDPKTAFVSYSREDWEFVLHLAKDLKARGARVWMDKLDIRAGQSWADEIEAAVHACWRMLIVLSPASVASRNVQAEVGYAISEGKEIIPIFYRQCNIPFRLLPYQYADFRNDYSAGLQDLLSSLSTDPTHASAVGAITGPLKSPVNEEERKRQSAILHAHLAEQHKHASAEQARLELEERKRAESADITRRELERQRVATEQARLEEEERQRTSAQQARLQQEAAERRAAEDKARIEELERQRLAVKQSRLAEWREQAAAAIAELEQRDRAAKAQSVSQRLYVLPALADWGRKLKRSLPPLRLIHLEAAPGMIVVGTLCMAVMVGSVVYETVASLRAKHRKPAPRSSQSQPHLAQKANFGPAPYGSLAPIAPVAETPSGQPAIEAASSSISREARSKSTLRTPAHTAASPASAPLVSTRNIPTAPQPAVSASVNRKPADAAPPAMSAKLADVYRAARSGDANAMHELAAAYQHGNGVAKNDEQAMAWYRKSADVGNSHAANKLGDIYRDGLGLSQDYHQAVAWYRKAAEAGDPRGMSNLGKMYDNGWGVPTDYRQAASWYRKAAEAGDLQGMTSLGVMYEDGLGVQKDLRQAVSWYRKAADANDATGMSYLADMYEYGKGQRKDMGQAFYWYSKAAEAGDAGGMNKVAAMYETGQGVHKDQSQAIVWYRKAAEIGNQNAKNNLKRLGESPR